MKESTGYFINNNATEKKYIKKYKIDRQKSMIKIFYLDGSRKKVLYDKDEMHNIRVKMYSQYEHYNKILDGYLDVCFINPVMYYTMKKIINRQKYYMDNQNLFSECRINKYRLDKVLNKRELNKLRKSKEETDSYFNLSSINDYDLKTLEKIKRVVIENKPKYKVKKKNHKNCR